MPSSWTLKLLSEVRADLVKDYLIRQGMRPEIIDWKYFDIPFNRNRERGCVLVRDDVVQGFLGLIPFNIACNGRVVEAAWCCDWSRDLAQSTGGMGIMLVKQAQRLYPFLFGIEGSDMTKQIFPRLATHTIPHAAIRMQLPLRLGAYVERISR